MAVAGALAAAGCGDPRVYPDRRPSAADVPCPSDMVGYAVINGGADGGAGKRRGGRHECPVTVSDVAGLTADAAATRRPNRA